MKILLNVWMVTIAMVAQAQWTSDVELNTLAAESALDVVATLGTSDGSTCIVFWKEVGAPANLELRLQKLNPDGTAVFGPDGISVSSEINMSTYTVMGMATLDADDNIYIGVTATNDELGHVFKMDANGNHLWPEGGVTFSGGYAIEILPLSSGEAVVAWLNVPNALMQKFSASGEPVWAEPQAVVSGTSKTAPGELFELSNGDIELIFHTYNFGISSTLWAQRYGGNTGDAIWPAPVQLSDKTTAWNTRYSVGQIEDAIYIGYSAATGLRFDSFLQRVDPDGVLPWGLNGVDFDVNEADYEVNTRIAVGEGLVWSICNYKDQNQTQNGEHVQCFDSETGARLLTENAHEVFPIGSEKVHASDLHLRDGLPIFLMESGADNGVTPTTLHLVALDAEGNFLWPEESQPMGTFAANKTHTALTAPVEGQVVGVWREDKGSGAAVFAQNFIFEGGGSSVDVDQRVVALQPHPNPASELIAIDLGSFGSPDLVEWRVVDVQGQSVPGHVQKSGQVIHLDVSGWPAGLYRLHGTSRSDVVFRAAFQVIH